MYLTIQQNVLFHRRQQYFFYCQMFSIELQIGLTSLPSDGIILHCTVFFLIYSNLLPVYNLGNSVVHSR